MTDATYQGWTNHSTWAVALWLDNDQGSYNYWREQAREAYRNATPTQSDVSFGITRRVLAARSLADLLKDEIEEGSPLADDATLYSDLLSSAIADTNWREIAESWLDVVATEIDAEQQEDDDSDSDD